MDRLRAMASGRFTRGLLASLDSLTGLLRKSALVRTGETAAHMEVGAEGEELAYFRLREWGYTVVARNWRNARRKGELDIVAWEGNVLCFVEVKTRTRKTFIPAEAAVHREKMRELVSMARLYLRQLPPGTRYRFDVVSVYLEAGKDPELSLFKDAFGWRTLQS
jgi:putative endonuclease